MFISKNLYNSILTLVLVVQFGSHVAENLAQNETNEIKRLMEPRSSAEELFINETLEVITEGENEIILDDSHKEIVLVVGLTGAGKTTISKFIADFESLQSYDNGFNILIRDKNGTISENSTIISKTIFPELVIDHSTDHLYYDMPGFSDTRNTSIEIANAWFMKKVANHASSVKILFVVSQSTLQFGEHRDIFLKLLTHATEYIKEPKKFADAISLVVSKVKVRGNTEVEDVIEEIANFLLGVKDDLGEVTTDPEKQRTASDLIDAFLSKDPHGNYTKISFFKQPKQVGPLKAIPSVMEQWSHIKQVVENNTVFVNSSPEDFGISVSSGGQLLSLNLTRITNDKITSVILSIQDKIQSHYIEKIPTSPMIFIGTLVKEFEMLELIPATLNKMKERSQFLLRLMSLLSESKVNVSQEIAEIRKLMENLEFFEKVSGQRLAFRASENSRPIEAAVVAVKSSLLQRLVEINVQLGVETEKIARDLETGLDQRLRQGESKSKLMEEMVGLAARIDAFVSEAFEETQSFNQFLNHLKTITSPVKIEKLTHDFQMQEQNCKFDFVINLSQWLTPFVSLENRLITKSRALQVQIHSEKLEKDLETKQGEFERSQKTLIKEIFDLGLNNSQTEIQIRSETDSLIRKISQEHMKCQAETKNVFKLHLQKLKHLEELHEQSKSSYNLEIASIKQTGENIQLAGREKIATLNKNLRQEKQDQDAKLEEIAKTGDEQDEHARLFHTTNMQQAQSTCTNNLQNQDKICNQQLTDVRKTSELLKKSFQDKQTEAETTCRANKQAKAQSCNVAKSNIGQQTESELKIINASLDQMKKACDQDLKNIDRNCTSEFNRINTLVNQNKQKLNDELEENKNTCRIGTDNTAAQLSSEIKLIYAEIENQKRHIYQVCGQAVAKFADVLRSAYEEELEKYETMAEDSESQGFSDR